MRDGRSAKTAAKGTECAAGADYTSEDTAFILAVAAWQKRHKVRFPAATDYLTVAKSEGYARRAELDAVILQCANRLADCAELLGRLSEKKEKRKS